MSTDEGNFASMMDGVARQLLGEPNAKLSKPSAGKLRYGSRGSLEVNTIKGTWYDHEVGEGGGVVDLVARQERCDRDAAKAWLQNFRNGGNGAGNGSADDGIEATYDYVNETGNLLFQVCRMRPGARARFLQRRPNGHGEWVWNLDDTRRVLFRLPQLIEAVERGMTVFVPEGEKDVLTVLRLGYAATCNPGGAAKRGSKWRPEYNEHFRDADVVLMPDNDEVGWKHVNAVGEALTGIAKRIRILMMPGGHKDVSDWVAAGGTQEQLAKMVAEAPTWVSPAAAMFGDHTDDEGAAAAKKAEDELLSALARTPPGIERSRRRKRLAKQLGVTQGAIDEELERRWPDGGNVETAPLYGHWSVEPWPEVAEGDALLRDIIRRIHRHVVCSHDAALATALWVMLSWVHDEVAIYSPILNVNSAEPESGKSTLLGILSFLMPRAIATVHITESALYRSITKWSPSFCIDEFDDVLSGRTGNEGLKSIINCGHTRNEVVLRCEGDSHDPAPFLVFCPKAVGMIGRKMPSATLSRCIFIELRRKKRTELAEKFGHVDDPGLADLRSRLLRWATDNMEALRGAAPPMPEVLINRGADNWSVQFAIADLCGDDWGDKARATALSIEGRNDSQSITVRLLADIKRIWDEDGGDEMLSATMTAKLNEDQDGPWVEFSHGKPLTATKLARLLRHHGIIVEHVHPPGLSRGRGYRRVHFQDAFERYLPMNKDQEGSV
jgi:Protein of unknown function (DUF3631)